eukprot:gene5802-8008_t
MEDNNFGDNNHEDSTQIGRRNISEISVTEVDKLRRLGKNWTKIALEIGFTVRSLYNWRIYVYRIDPEEGVEDRKHKAVRRRVYRTSGPHHLWHALGRKS